KIDASLNFLPLTCKASSSKSAPLQNISLIPGFCWLYPTIGLPSKNQTGCACQILLSASSSSLSMIAASLSQIAEASNVWRELNDLMASFMTSVDYFFKCCYCLKVFLF